MSDYTETGFLFMESFQLDNKEIRNHLISKVEAVEKQENIILKPFKLYINVVENRDEKKLGYSYVWVDKDKIYNIFCGLNLDGSVRIRRYEDPNWQVPEKQNSTDTDNWADLVEEEDRYICPMLEEYLPPLTNIKLYEKENYDLRIGPLTIHEIGKNSIYTKNLESWITEKLLLQHIGFFEKDDKKYKNNITYPIIKIKNNKKDGNSATIIFSPKYPRTASFLIKIIKKIKISKGDNEKLIFFSQSKYNRN